MKRGALHYLEPIATPTRGVAVLDAMAEMIERAGLKVGDLLPPEVAIASALGVGRSTIREALNRWEGLGLIRRRRGDGTYLTGESRLGWSLNGGACASEWYGFWDGISPPRGIPFHADIPLRLRRCSRSKG